MRSLTVLYGVSCSAGVLLASLIALPVVGQWNTWAVATDLPTIGVGGEYITVSALSGVIAWLLTKTIPGMATTQAAAMDRLGDKIDGLRAESRDGNDRMIDMLRDVLLDSRGKPKTSEGTR